ncbi:MAG: Crp/Fnr family transcriptional regulator [Tannerellaceae bacterium]|jgi:CRP-like cAMP-binding protein|nr:Crp/Fnr family transcriptional regulator [Tannerellaceae bacterium]
MNTNKSVAQRLGEIVFPLSNNDVEKLASILIRTELKKNEIFLREGEISNQMYFVQSGLIRQYYYKNGRDLTEHFACENNIFINIESYLLQEPTHLIIEALEPTVLYGIPYRQLSVLMAEYRDISVLYQRFVEQILISVQQKIDSFRYETANERYYRLLKERPEIIKRAPLVHIASYLLMSPETLSRVRSGVL